MGQTTTPTIARVTPADQWITYTRQDSDEQGAVFADLQANPGAYLSHPDAEVRSLADWTLEYFGIRKLRPALPYLQARDLAHTTLRQLYRRLRALAAKG